MQSILTRVVSGGGTRKTRLHDEFGRRVPLSRAIRNGPRALVTNILRLAVGYRPQAPWISYDAQAELAQLLTPETEMLEFGSGMSTAWYARRAGHVVSVERDEQWYRIVGRQLSAFANVDYRFADDPAAYAGAGPDKLYDFIMIDGAWRDKCAEFAVAHLKPSGMIYLDNCDKGQDGEVTRTGDVPRARRMLLDFAARENRSVREFTDFAPTQFQAQRGLLIGPAAA